MKHTVLFAVITCFIGCSTANDEPTPEEQQQEVKDKGKYCCTHDGESTTPECNESAAGSIYLQDFSNVDASGRGDACGWILK
jgi:hypothetical protein